MTNTEIVEKIKRVLEDPEGVANDELEDLANVFARRLRAVDEGLGRARSALQSGQLCEADRQLRDEQLIEASETLMFDQFEEWQSACRILGLETPVAISKGAGADLLDFSCRFEPVREAFAKYRLLELEGGSPRSRLELLYEIKTSLYKYADFFRRPLQRLEGEFDKGVAGKLAASDPFAIPQRDLLRWRACLTSPERETPSDSNLIRQIDSRLARFESDAALEKLASLVQRWENATTDAEKFACNAAYYNGEEEFVKALTVAPKELVDRLNRLVASAQSAERALNAERTYQAKLKRLQGYIARSEDVDELESVYQETELAAQAANAQIPNAVQSDYEARVDSIVSRKRRKRTFLIALTLLVVAFFAFLIVSITTRGKIQKGAQASAAEIMRKLEDFDKYKSQAEYYPSLAKAKEIVERNATEHPQYAEVEEYKLALERFEQESVKEENRRSKFAKALEDIEREHEDGRAVPNLLRPLKNQALTEEERAEYNEAYRSDAELAKGKSQNRVESFQAELTTLSNDYKALEEGENLSNAERLAEIRRIRDRVRSLAGNEVFGVPQALIDERQALQTAVEGYEKRALSAATTSETAGDLLEAVGDSDAYLAALEKLRLKLLKDDGLVAAIESAKRDVANVSRAASWNALTQRRPRVLDWCSDGSTFKSLDTTLSKERANLAFAPDYDAATQLVADMRPFVEGGGFASARIILTKNLKEFERPLWVLYDPGLKNYYYVVSNPEETKNLKYLPHAGGVLQDFNVDEFSGKLVAREAPQNEFARIVSTNLTSDSTSDKWFAAVSELLRTFDSESEETLDPALKYKFYAIIAQSVARFPELNELTEWFNESRKNKDANPNANEYTPGNQLETARVAALSVLRRAPDVDELLTDAEEFWQRLNEPVGTVYEWIGYLDYGGSEPTVRTKAALSGYDALWIAVGANATATRVGEIVDGRATITDEKSISNANRWTPIYASRSSER